MLKQFAQFACCSYWSALYDSAPNQQLLKLHDLLSRFCSALKNGNVCQTKSRCKIFQHAPLNLTESLGLAHLATELSNLEEVLHFQSIYVLLCTFTLAVIQPIIMRLPPLYLVTGLFLITLTSVFSFEEGDLLTL
ncbi:hypothetical protein ILYODFUR_023685 [Ilyodon furcidens]|uniref:Uncharacterized protein n=1 Tax=Ilyodon furcidens TaxID=33524 RepID=A0ABV0TNL7_9TELE